MAGTISKRSNNTWIVRIFLGRDANGRTRHFNKTIHGTKKDAQRYLTAKLREKDLGTFVEPTSMTLNAHLDLWLEQVAKVKLRQTTLASYEMILKNYVRPRLGAKKLCEIQTFEVQKLYNSMATRGLSARTVRYTHTVLSSALKHAIRMRTLQTNPCDHCELPRLERTEMKCFSEEEARRFLEAAKTDRYFPLFF